jgi:hypothetical protein
LGSNASLLHLAFDVDHISNYTLWLLASSIYYPNALDMVIKVTFGSEWSNIKTEDITVIPTQQCEAHRVLPTESNVFTRELTTSKLLTIFNFLINRISSFIERMTVHYHPPTAEMDV